MPTLSATNIKINLKEHYLFNDLSFSVEAGQVLSLMGPSGCGKSTLLSYLAGSLRNEFNGAGSVYLGDKNIGQLATEKRHVGMLYQSPLLFEHMTNLENLMFAIPPQLPAKQRKELALTELSKLSLADKAMLLPSSLSGGQQARMSLLRTLLSQPEYLLLDEPFAKLDSNLRHSVREFVLEQIEKAKLPTILVTHDLQDADAMGGTLLKL